MSRIIDITALNWREQANFMFLPEHGLSVLVNPVWRPNPDDPCHVPEGTVDVTVVDVSAEDVAVIVALSSLMTLPEDIPVSEDDPGDGVYHRVHVFAGRRMGWTRWCSVSAAWSIHAYFEDEELQAEVLGTEALRWFEGDDVREAREREMQVVSAIWRDAGEVEA